MKDSHGFLWVGTKDGLNRFDGSTVLPYRKTFGDTTSLINNEIECLLEDPLHRVWVGTASGLSILQPEGSVFQNYYMQQDENDTIDFSNGIKALGLFDNKIWIVTHKEIFISRLDSIYFERVHFKSASTKLNTAFFFTNNITVTENGIWFLSSRGLLYTEDGISFISRYYNPNAWSIFETKNWMSTMSYDGTSTLYFASFDYQGVYTFDLRLLSLDSIPFPLDPRIVDVATHSLSKSIGTELWGGTISHGVFCMNTKTGFTRFYLHENTDPNSLRVSQAYHILTDAQGTVFVATNRGLDYSNPLQPQFDINMITHSELAGESIAEAEDENGTLWLATLDNGLFSYDPTTKKIEQFSLPDDYNSIWTLQYKDNALLLVTKGGMGYFSLRTKKFKPLALTLPSEIQEMVKNMAVFIFEDTSETLWIGFFLNGILKLNLTTGEYFHFDPMKSLNASPFTPISTVTVDENEVIWIGYLANNITRIQTSNDSISNFSIPQGESKEKIRSIASLRTDHQGNLWIAVNQVGLFKYHIQSNSYTLYDSRHGLSSLQIGSIVEDSSRHLWISTSNGLNKFNPASATVTLYNTSDGLYSNQFESSPMFMAKNGRIYVWSDQAILSFNPLEIQPNPHRPYLTFTSFKKSGRPYAIASTDKCLDFTYKDKMITFDFFGINFIDPTKTQYAYKLEGYDEDWNYSRNQPSASYPGLPGGKYILRIKVTNKANTWDVPETTMAIHVKGPFWQSWWFILSCVAISAFVIYGIYRIKLSQFKKIQTIRNKISKDLHDDIGSTLSSISIYSAAVGKLDADRFPEIKSTISHIGHNARTAMENMSDIVWAINPANETFHDMIERLRIFAFSLLDARNIALLTNIPESLQNIKLNMQQRKNVYLILREAMHNVAKYSQATECILSATMSNKRVKLHIMDNGIGFDKLVPSLGGNGLSNMRQRAAELNGSLDIQSELCKGTSLTLQFTT